MITVSTTSTGEARSMKELMEQRTRAWNYRILLNETEIASRVTGVTRGVPAREARPEPAREDTAVAHNHVMGGECWPSCPAYCP